MPMKIRTVSANANSSTTEVVPMMPGLDKLVAADLHGKVATLARIKPAIHSLPKLVT
ncbi:MAG TPA: hypothetical protein VF472_11140 [Burkholderiaceae bacterium]